MAEKKAAVGNAADPEQVKKATERGQSLRDRELNDLRWVLSHDAGRRFLWRMIGICAPMRNPLSDQPIYLGYNVGMAEVGRVLLEEAMEASLEQYLLMFREGKKDEREKTA